MELSSPAADRANVQSLMVSYAKHAESYDSAHSDFDSTSDRSFGDFGFHFYPDRNVLEARVLVIRTHLHDWPESNGPTQRNVAALNDPTIGGMYDQGGGHFVLDQAKDMLFLVKDYPASTPETQFLRDFDSLREVASLWLTKWLPLVTEQAAGTRPKPTQRITRANDPYPRTE